MSNDPKNQKTIMGWSPQFQGPGQPQPPGTPQVPGGPAQQGWPQQPVSPPGWPQPQIAQQPFAQQPPQQWQPPAPAQPQWQQPQPQWQQPAPQPQWQQPAPQPQWQQPAPQPQWQQPAAMPGWPPQPAMPSMPASMPSEGRSIPGANATRGVSARLRFIRLTYLHLFAAILAFIGLEYLLFTNETLVTKVSAPFVKFALGGRWNWAVVLAVFSALSMLTHWLAHQTRNKVIHYIGLVIYVAAEAVIFVPLLAIVQWKTAEIIAKGGGNPNIVRDAAIITLGIFGALTATVLLTKKDFSFLRSALIVAGAAAFGLIALSLIFGFNLGIVFAIAMVLLAAGQILYETSQVMAHYDPEDYVGASLSLFSSIALLFWYIIQIVMELKGD